MYTIFSGYIFKIGSSSFVKNYNFHYITSEVQRLCFILHKWKFRKLPSILLSEDFIKRLLCASEKYKYACYESRANTKWTGHKRTVWIEISFICFWWFQTPTLLWIFKKDYLYYLSSQSFPNVYTILFVNVLIFFPFRPIFIIVLLFIKLFYDHCTRKSCRIDRNSKRKVMQE